MPRRQRAPGPGAYNVPQNFGSTTTKAYSMRLKTEYAMKLDQTPGPAEYLPKDKVALKASAAWGFGTSKRNPMGFGGAPGPGEYTPSNPNITSPRCCFGTSTRPQPSTKHGTPGPGSYNPLRVKDTVHLSATIQGARYDPAADKQSPGPAAYNQSVRIQAKAPPSWGFGTAARTTNAVQDSSLLNPGPGSYEAKPTFHGPKISITPRREEFDW